MPRTAKEKYHIKKEIIVNNQPIERLYLKDALTRELTTDIDKSLTTDEANATEFIAFMQSVEPTQKSHKIEWQATLAE